MWLSLTVFEDWFLNLTFKSHQINISRFVLFWFLTYPYLYWACFTCFCKVYSVPFEHGYSLVEIKIPRPIKSCSVISTQVNFITGKNFRWFRFCYTPVFLHHILLPLNPIHLKMTVSATEFFSGRAMDRARKTGGVVSSLMAYQWAEKLANLLFLKD